MKKIIALLLISFGLQSQTLLKFKQIEQSGATGSLVITTGTNGVLTYTPQIPYSKITGTPSLSGYIPYTGATSSVNLGANNFSVGGTSTLNTIYVPSTATVNGALLANSTSTFLNNMKVNGVLNVYDGGTQTIKGGVLSQVNGAVLSLGVNTGSSNLFGGSYTQAEQGALFQVDSRAGNAAFTWNTRAPTVSATGANTVCMSLTNAGLLTILPQASSHLSVKNSASGFMTDFFDNSTHKSMEFYGDNSAHGSIIRMYNTGTTNNVQLVGSGASGQNNFFLTAKTGFGTSTPQATVDVSGTFSVGLTSQLTSSVQIGAAATASDILQVNTSAVGTGALIGNARIGVWGGSASYAVFRHQSATDATGYALIQDNSGFTYLNASTQVQCLVGANAIATFTDRKVNFNPVASSSGANINFNFTCPNSTGQTASTNAPYFKVIGGTKQFATGAHTTLYFNHLSANTLAYVGASTATDVYGLFVEKSVAGTNATITRNWGIGTDGAISCVDNLKITSANNPSISIGSTGSFIRDISGLIRVASTNSANVELAYNATSVRLVAGANGVSIKKGTDAVASAALEVSSTTQGFLPPRMTTTQKNAISSPSEGLVVYDTTLHKLCIFTGTVWETVTSL